MKLCSRCCESCAANECKAPRDVKSKHTQLHEEHVHMMATVSSKAVMPQVLNITSITNPNVVNRRHDMPNFKIAP